MTAARASVGNFIKYMNKNTQKLHATPSIGDSLSLVLNIIITPFYSYYVSYIVLGAENMSDKRTDKLPFFERVRRAFDIPSGLIGDEYIGVSGEHEVEISGCKALCDYSDSKIILCVGKRRTVIYGECLELCTFSGGYVRVNGIIKSLTFGEDTEEF